MVAKQKALLYKSQTRFLVFFSANILRQHKVNSAIQWIKSVYVVLEEESQIFWNGDGPVVTLSLRANDYLQGVKILFHLNSQTNILAFLSGSAEIATGTSFSLRHIATLSYSLWQVTFRDSFINRCLHSDRFKSLYLSLSHWFKSICCRTFLKHFHLLGSTGL